MMELTSRGFVSAHSWRVITDESTDAEKMVAHAASLEGGHELSSSFDVYEGDGFFVLVGWGYHDCWIVYCPPKEPKVYHRCQQEELYDLRIMPFNWDIPF